MQFDFVLADGQVLDPSQRLDARLDVAVKDGRIAALGPPGSFSAQGPAITLGGRLVTPGLVDIHTHFYKGVSALGLDVDDDILPTGVTTAVDAGSAGAVTFPGFREYCLSPASTRVFAFLNLSRIGLILDDERELSDPSYADPRAIAEVLETGSPFVVGIKVRVSTRVIGDLGFGPLETAMQVADRFGCPLMVHITRAGVPLTALLDRLRSGDIVTHVLHGRGHTVVDEGVLDKLMRSQARGVVADVGHGAGSFAFSTAEAAFRAGFRPDTISTDLHSYSINGPCFDLPTTMSKFLALGMSLAEVVAATTSSAARAIGKEANAGSLLPGREADVAVFDRLEGEFALEDCEGHVRTGTILLRPYLTLRMGRMVPPPAPGPRDIRPGSGRPASAVRSSDMTSRPSL